MRIVDEAVLSLFRGPGRCENCGRQVRNREPHHLRCRGAGGGSRPDVRINLIALCSVFSGGLNCHHEAHAGRLLYKDLLALVAARESTTQDEIEARVLELRNAPKAPKNLRRAKR